MVIYIYKLISKSLLYDSFVFLQRWIFLIEGVYWSSSLDCANKSVEIKIIMIILITIKIKMKILITIK